MSHSSPTEPIIFTVEPSAGVEGGIVVISGTGFLAGGTIPLTFFGGFEARPTIVSDTRLILPIPPDATAGPIILEVGSQTATSSYIIGEKLATDLHPVANPVVDPAGTIYTTISGRRGQRTPVSLVRITPSGSVEPLAATPMNPTGLALQADGSLLISSRYEGRVYRLLPSGDIEVIAEGLGIATGLCLDETGVLYIGDRTGTIYRLRLDGQAEPFASLPPSVAAFHLALGPDGHLYATAPTLSNEDVIYRINRFGDAEPYWGPLERPQGLAFDRAGHLWVVAGLKGRRGVYRFDRKDTPKFMVTGANIVGLAFVSTDHLILASTSTIFRLPIPP